MNESVNDEAVYKTAPATLGLLIIAVTHTILKTVLKIIAVAHAKVKAVKTRKQHGTKKTCNWSLFSA